MESDAPLSRNQSDPSSFGNYSEEPLHGEIIEPAHGTSSESESSSKSFLIKYPRSRPVVTWVLLGLSILIYIVQIGTEHFLGVDLPLAFGAKFGPLIAAGQVWRLLTPILLHGSLVHLLFNMYALYILGKDIEPTYGHLDFLLLYLISGFGGNVFSYVFAPESISVGASSSLFGLIAAQGMLLYKNKKFIRNYPKAIQNVIMVVAINLFIGMNARIDNWGHLGGLAAGGLVAFFAGPVWDLRLHPEAGYAELFDKTSAARRRIVFLLVFLLLAIFALFSKGL